MPTPRIILDCDPGHDDAVALLLAAHTCDLLGVTTVSGNAPLHLTTHNALISAQIYGLDVPVYAGADRPLVAEAQHAAFIHGETGLGGPELPDLTRQAAGEDAVRFIIDTVRAQENVWLVAVGPLTNIALALRAAPDLAGKLGGVSIMGGSAGFGNVTPVAEFNIWADPEAADIVYRSGAPLIMCGLNVTHQWLIDEETVHRIREVGGDAATFVADMLTYYSQAYGKKFSGRAEGPLHDPCAVLALSHPELLEFGVRHVAVECAGAHTRGMTVVDERGVKESEGGNVKVAYKIDAEGASKLLFEALSARAR